MLIDTHWFTTLEYVLNAQERLRGLYTSEELPQMIHEYAYDYAGDPELAAAIVEAARAGGLRAIAAGYPTLPLHYPTLNVMHYFNPGAARRVLSMGVCQTAGIPNDVAFGAAMGAAIRASRPARRADRGGRHVASLLGLRPRAATRLGLARRHQLTRQPALRRKIDGVVPRGAP